MNRVFVIGLCIAAGAVPAWADDSDSAMRAELEALKAKVRQLESLKAEIRQLEARIDAREAADDRQIAVTAGTNGARAQRQGGERPTGTTAPDKAEVRTIAGDVYDEKQAREVNLGGSLRFNYTDAEFTPAQVDRGGDLRLAVFNIKASADIDNVLFNLDYRFYDYMRTIHDGWIGYRFADDSQVEIGVTQVPFGLLPFASNNYYFSSNFYIGLEDDYDAGIKYSGSRGPFDYAVAFFKNDEKGGNGDDERYSLDPTNLPVGDGIDGAGSPITDSTSDAYGDAIQETNTGALRLAYTLGRDSDYSTEFGASGQYGRIYNNTLQRDYGDNWAAALHMNGQWQRVGVMLQATRYEYDLDGGETAIGAAAYAFNYPFASEGSSYIANVSYTIPLDYGPFDSLKLYNDYSYVGDKSGGYANTWQNVTGALLTAGRIYTYFDLINGKNEPFVNGFMTGDADETETLFNMNIGYYF